MLERGSRNLHEPRRQPGANYHAPCLNHRLSSFGFQCKMIVILIGTESTQHISRINPSLPSTASSSGAGGRSGCGMPGILGTSGTPGTPGRLPHGALTTSSTLLAGLWLAVGCKRGRSWHSSGCPHEKPATSGSFCPQCGQHRFPAGDKLA